MSASIHETLRLIFITFCELLLIRVSRIKNLLFIGIKSLQEYSINGSYSQNLKVPLFLIFV